MGLFLVPESYDSNFIVHIFMALLFSCFEIRKNYVHIGMERNYSVNLGNERNTTFKFTMVYCNLSLNIKKIPAANRAFQQKLYDKVIMIQIWFIYVY